MELNREELERLSKFRATAALLKKRAYEQGMNDEQMIEYVGQKLEEMGFYKTNKQEAPQQTPDQSTNEQNQ